MSEIEQKTDITEHIQAVAESCNKEATRRIISAIENTSWPTPEQQAVKSALGLERHIDIKAQAISWLYSTAIALDALILGQTIIESQTQQGPITDILQHIDSTLRYLPQPAYDLLKALTGWVGSITKSPGKFEDPLPFIVIGSASALILFAAGAKGLLENFSLSKVKPKSVLAREEAIDHGTWPVDLIAHCLAFGATDSSLSHPLGEILMQHIELVPVHRGDRRPKDVAPKLWITAGIDKSVQITRGMAERTILLLGNCVDAAAVLVNCMREITVYRPLDASDTERAPEGIIPPSAADAIIERTAELTRLIYGEGAPPKLYIAIISRFTTEAVDLDGKPIQGRSYFEEPDDEPTIIIEPEQLVERALQKRIAELKKEDIIKGEVSAYVLVTGDSSTDKQTMANLEQSLKSEQVVERVTTNYKDANIVIISCADDQQSTALVQIARRQLDEAGKTNVPIFVMQKRPDKSNLPDLAHVYPIAVQQLIAQEVDRIFTEELTRSEVSRRTQRKAKRIMRRRQKRRVST